MTKKITIRQSHDGTWSAKIGDSYLARTTPSMVIITRYNPFYWSSLDTLCEAIKTFVAKSDLPVYPPST